MTLVSCQPIDFSEQTASELSVPSIDLSGCDDEQLVERISSPSGLGALRQNSIKHYYSTGAFNLIQLVMYILKQTGPAHVFLATYSISDRSITALKRHLDQGIIRSIRFLLDNRVRSISPKPFDHLITSFPNSVRCRAIHAKVALIYNDQWQISVVGSQNATHNPKLERGIIHSQPEVFEFDYKILSDEFNSGTA